MSLYNGASTSNFREYANNSRFADLTPSHTIAIWVNPAGTPAAQWAFAARGLGTISGEFTLGTPASATFNLARASITTTSGLQTVADTAAWATRKWFHMVQTYDGTTMRVFVDGIQRNSSTPLGSYTQTATTNIRLWMRTDATIGTTDCFLEQFGIWRIAFSQPEVDWLARGGDFTKINRNDAILLDPLRDPNGVDLIGGLGVNTGTISVKESAPVILRSPNVRLARPLIMRAGTRKNYDKAPAGAASTFDASRFMPFFGR